MEGKCGEGGDGAQLRANFEPLWRKNDRKALKNGTRATIFWVKENPKFRAYERDGALVGSKAPSKFVTGDSYAGDWLDNAKHGFGTQTWSSGKKYQGDFKFGKRDGTGTLWTPAPGTGKLRKEYTGKWKRDKRHGVGIMYDKEGNKYEGGWAAGKKQGRGKLLYANGDVYEGEFSGDRREGLGIMTLANGNRYEGHWQADQKEGPGRYFYASTRKMLQAEWMDGSPRCGVYSDWPEEYNDVVFTQEEDGAASQNFTLPSCELADPQTVLSGALKETRRARAEKFGRQAIRSEKDEQASFSSEELEDIRAAFASVDKGKQGWILGNQLADVLHALGIFPAQEDVEQLLDELGAAGDSSITLDAFVGLLASLRAPDDDDDDDDDCEAHDEFS